jgi:phosphate transport system permease protein
MRRRTKDLISTVVMKLLAGFMSLLVLILFVSLLLKSVPILKTKSIFGLLLDSVWMPLKGDFGLLPFIVGTLEVTGIALLIAVPICLLSSIYLSEYASSRFREIARPFVDLLSGIPSVIYGFWGILVIVPAVRWVGSALGFKTTGYCLLSAGIVLAIMVFPIIISVVTEVLCSVKYELREISLGLGLTKWEMVKHVILKSAIHGIIAAIILGFARAFGETIAVLMVIGNQVNIPSNVFESAYTLPALIANNYGEMMSIPLYDSALMFAGLILLVVVAGFNLAAHLILLKIKRRMS